MRTKKKRTLAGKVDYQNFTTRATPRDERRKLNVGDWWSNSARCMKCGDVIRSVNRHDYRECSCGAIAVDGGSWYPRRVGDLSQLQEQSIKYDDASGAEDV